MPHPAHYDETPGSLRRYRHLIGGEWRDAASGESFESIDPANGQAWALIPRGNAADADRAVAAARAAFESAAWSGLHPSARGELLMRVATYLDAHIAGIAPVETRD